MKVLDKLKSLRHSESLLGRSVRSGGILAAGSLSENLLRFIRNIILARLLAPDAFGLMATIMATVAAAEAFAEVGLTKSIIQNKKGSEKEFLNVIWWFSAFRAIMLYMIAFFAAPLIADFLNKPEATLILRTALIVILLRGLTSPNIFLLHKELKFNKWVIFTQSASILGILAAIISAFYLHNVWALVLGYVIEAFLIFLFSYIFYPLIPKFQINLSHAKNIMSFSRKFFGLPILMVLYGQADNFVIGKVLSLSVLGLYFLARDLADMPNKIFSRISPVFMPAFSLIQDDREKLKNTLLKITEIIVTFGLPFFTFLIAFSSPLLGIIYAPEYSIVAIPFSIFCLSVFLYILSVLMMNVVFATGNPDQFRNASLARTFVFLILLYPATKYLGLIGAALSTVLSMCLAFAIQIHYLKDLLNINIHEYFAKFIKGVNYSFIVLIPGIVFVIALPSHRIIAMVIGSVFCILAWCFGVVSFSRQKMKK
ncbi:MAG: oligosaccharide flippase family protein [Smithella sp.]